MLVSRYLAKCCFVCKMAEVVKPYKVYILISISRNPSRISTKVVIGIYKPVKFYTDCNIFTAQLRELLSAPKQAPFIASL